VSVIVKVINKMWFTSVTSLHFDCQNIVTWMIPELPSGAAVIQRLRCVKIGHVLMSQQSHLVD